MKTLDSISKQKFLHDYADEVALMVGAFLPMDTLHSPAEVRQLPGEGPVWEKTGFLEDAFKERARSGLVRLHSP